MPSDEFGSTIMSIADVQWINHLLIVIGFHAGYFCIVTRFGHVINLVTPMSLIQYFYSFEDLSGCNKISIHKSFISLYNSSSIGTISISNIPTDLSIISSKNPLIKPNTILSLLILKPQLSTNQDIAQIFSDSLEKEIPRFQPQNNERLNSLLSEEDYSKISFVNPFPTELQIDFNKVFVHTLNMIKTLQWKNECSSNIFKTLLCDFENTCRIFMQCKLAYKQ